MRGEEKGINKASKALIWLRVGSGGGFGGWGCRLSDFGRCRETSSKLSEERQSPSHPRAGKAIQDYTDSSKRQTWLESADGARITWNNVQLVITGLNWKGRLLLK